MPTFPSSENLFAQAQKLMPGGVNSPVRAWQAVGGTPFLISKGVGSRIYDLDDSPAIHVTNGDGGLLDTGVLPDIGQRLTDDVAQVADGIHRHLWFVEGQL